MRASRYGRSIPDHVPAATEQRAMAARVAAHEAAKVRKRRNERLCALAVVCIVIAVSVALFYSATN